jgi:DNA polymerase-3 subunit gamma/tau
MPTSAPAIAPTPASIEALGAWRTIIARVRVRRPALASVLEHAALVAIGPERVALGYEAGSFLVGQATEAPARELLSTEIAAHFGHAVEVAFETLPRGHGVATIAQLEGAERKERVDAARRAVEGHPLVTAAITMLGAELKDVRLAEVAEA